MASYVALLRGINVGGKNRLPMKDLAGMFEAAGCSSVRTYIQSGNVVFDAGTRVARTLAVTIEAAIQQQFALQVPVVLRSAAEMQLALRSNPFLAAGEASEERELHLMFLSAEPSPDALAKLDPQRGAPDRYVVRGKDIYLRIASAATTKLTNAYFDSRLGVVSTGRNWRTVTTLAEMAVGQ